ncbi:MAG: hypothetical protein AAGH15_02810 [Myxococcota bacterium]
MRRLRLHGPARIVPGAAFPVSLELDPRAGVPRALVLRLTRSRRLLGDAGTSQDVVLERSVDRAALADGRHALELTLPADLLPSHEGLAGWVRYALSLRAAGTEALTRPVHVVPPPAPGPHPALVLRSEAARPSGRRVGFQAVLEDGLAHLGGVLGLELRLHGAAAARYRGLTATLTCHEGGIERVQRAEHLGEEQLRVATRRIYLTLPSDAPPSRLDGPPVRWRLAVALDHFERRFAAHATLPVLGAPPPWTAPPLLASRGDVRAWAIGRGLRLRFPALGRPLDLGPLAGADRGLPYAFTVPAPASWTRTHRLRAAERAQGEAFVGALLQAGLADFQVADGWEGGLDLLALGSEGDLAARAELFVDALAELTLPPPAGLRPSAERWQRLAAAEGGRFDAARGRLELNVRGLRALLVAHLDPAGIRHRTIGRVRGAFAPLRWTPGQPAPPLLQPLDERTLSLAAGPERLDVAHRGVDAPERLARELRRFVATLVGAEREAGPYR